MELETVLTVFLLLGIAAAVISVFFRAVHIAVKIFGTSLGGLLLYLLLSYFGAGFGWELPVNVFTVLISLVGGIFGALGLTVFYLLF